MRKQAFFHADQEYQRKLEAFRRVQGHELHAIVPGIALGLAGFKRGMRQKGFQRRHVVVFDVDLEVKATAGADQLFEVFHTRLAFFGLVFVKMGFQAAFLDTEFDLAVEPKLD